MDIKTARLALTGLISASFFKANGSIGSDRTLRRPMNHSQLSPRRRLEAQEEMIRPTRLPVLRTHSAHSSSRPEGYSFNLKKNRTISRRTEKTRISRGPPMHSHFNSCELFQLLLLNTEFLRNFNYSPCNFLTLSRLQRHWIESQESQ